MELHRGRIEGSPSAAREDTFTGTVLADTLLDAPGVNVTTVMFPPGARTDWHTHERGQILLVQNGRGLIANADGERHEIGAGDVVWFAPGERHWHGATSSAYMTHVAITLGELVWEEPVTDEQYG